MTPEEYEAKMASIATQDPQLARQLLEEQETDIQTDIDAKLDDPTPEPDGIRAIKVAVANDMTHTLTVEHLTSYEDYSTHVEGMIEAVRLIVPSKNMDGQFIPVSRAHARAMHRLDLDTYDNQSNPSFIMWVNEEYLYKMPLQRWNFTAVGTSIWCGRPDLNTQGVLGNVLFTGDADYSGETLPLPAKAEEIIREAHKVTTEELLTNEAVTELLKISREEDLDHPFKDPLGGVSPESA